MIQPRTQPQPQRRVAVAVRALAALGLLLVGVLIGAALGDDVDRRQTTYERTLHVSPVPTTVTVTVTTESS